LAAARHLVRWGTSRHASESSTFASPAAGERVRRQYLVLAVFLAVFLGLAIACARTNLPWSDEAWFSTPAVNLMTKGYPGVSLLSEQGGFHHLEPLRAHRRAYYQPPMHMLVQVLWYGIVGFSLFTLRYLSICWGLVALGASYVIAKTLFRDERIPLLTVGLMAIDFTFVWTSSEGRGDMMTAALGLSAIAAYLVLREQHFLLAVFASQTLVAAAGLTHPMGFGYFMGLLFLTLYWDRSHLRLAHLAVAALPYVAGGAGWGWYISQDPEAFWAQFAGNAWGRVGGGNSIGHVLYLQIVERYLFQFGFAPDTKGVSHSKIVVLVAYALGLCGVFLNGDLRRRKPYRAFGFVLAICFATFTMLDFQDIHFFYLVHFLVLVIPMLAASAVWMWDSKPEWRNGLSFALIFVIAIQVSVSARRITQNPYRNIYLPTTAYLRQHAIGAGTIMGSAELGFELGFESDIIDDHRLGVISGKRATYIVIDKNRYADWIPTMATLEPEHYRQVRDLMDRNFHLVFDRDAYKIYARNGL
jgi:4-amino-4-deoxy-L-arabinose transferase-like glycosyltransferase